MVQTQLSQTLPNSAITNAFFNFSDGSTSDNIALGETFTIAEGEGINTTTTSKHYNYRS